MELLNEMEKKQQESNDKIYGLEASISQMTQKLNFISAMNGKMDSEIDDLKTSKLDKDCFDKLETEFRETIKRSIGDMAE